MLMSLVRQSDISERSLLTFAWDVWIFVGTNVANAVGWPGLLLCISFVSIILLVGCGHEVKLCTSSSSSSSSSLSSSPLFLFLSFVSVCLPVCVSLSVSSSLPLSLSLSVSLSVSLCLSVSLTLSVCLSVSLSLRPAPLRRVSPCLPLNLAALFLHLAWPASGHPCSSTARDSTLACPLESLNPVFPPDTKHTRGGINKRRCQLNHAKRLSQKPERFRCFLDKARTNGTTERRIHRQTR